jgi:hypothetical protein
MNNTIIVPGNNILLETEYGVLLGNTLANFVHNRKQAASKVQISKTNFIPSIDNGTLEVKAITNTGNQKYKTSLYFDDVEFLDEPVGNAATVIGADGDEYYLERIPLNQIDVKVKCTCLDFYYRFATWNSGDESLIGKPPPPYIRKTTTRPPVNPAKVPGVCKHIIKLTDKLISQRMVR